MFRKWYTDQRGSVTIFLILILAIVFTFVALFIDYARIAAMKVQSERLVHSAVRSVMSAYEPELQQEYGLFAYGESDGNQIMSGVLNGSMDHGDRGDAFSILPLELDTSSLQMERMLGEYEIFNRQIGEEMKYKAPIDFTLEIVNKFKPLSQSMKEASNTVDVLKKLQKLYDKREDALDEMLGKQKKAAQSVDNIASLIMEQATTHISNESLGGGIHSGKDIAAQYDDHVEKANELERLIAERQAKSWIELNEGDFDAEDALIDSYRDLINGYLQGSSSLLSTVSDHQNSSRADHKKMLPEALALWEEAYEMNEQMKRVIAESENRSQSDGYDQVSRENNPGSTEELSSEDSETIRQIRGQAEKLLLPEILLQDFKKQIEVQTNHYQTLDAQITSFSSAMSGALGTSSSSSHMKSAAIETRVKVDDYLRRYSISGSGNILDEELRKLEENRSSDKERKATEKKAKAKLKDAANILNKINELSDKAGGYMEEYRTLQQYYDESIAFNKQSAGDAYQGAQLDNDPYDAGASAMDNMDGLYGSMGGMTAGLQDEFYQNEYASLYFHHFDITRLGNIVSNPDSSIGDDLVEQLSIHNQELEYILYGFHNPVGNVSAAYAEIFGTRLAIRTMEGLVKSSKLGNPLLILAAALLYGIEMAIVDMIQLCQKGSIELSAYLKVEMTYRDYLRVFLFIHSNNDKKMSRMLSLIRFNTGINPAERATYSSGEVRIGMKLWFLPGIMKMFGSATNSEDEVEGNRYYAIKKADYSY
ncbi:TadE/TadG family type IV pilus assembly protein [Paenibacillus glacialis]|uniref:Uncharacterized protein n=1 Tax=Paenibacillus glacialis TaxID=494026 RepID=A0A168NWC0_9BACL|nr:Tad domain-containing protein [Paenibacillus glacialis]OAB46160.1 hypothetical protein PGLA_01850 [Paenibacillus glacialis]